MTDLPPQKLREVLVQMLYSYEQAQPSLEDLLSLMQETLDLHELQLPDIERRFLTMVSKQAMIDDVIRKHSLEFSFERIQMVEKALLRQAVFELLFDAAVHPKIVIAEAIRLCKKFCSPEALPFINGVLDAVYKKQGEHPL